MKELLKMCSLLNFNIINDTFIMKIISFYIRKKEKLRISNMFTLITPNTSSLTVVEYYFNVCYICLRCGTFVLMMLICVLFLYVAFF